MREFSMLRHVFAASRDLGSAVVVGPGDDMAQLELSGTSLLAAVDQVVAGRHYDPTRTTVEQIGRKAVNRSISDIAAMAGRPTACLVAVVLPPGLGEPRACDLFDAMRTTGATHGCPLIGGDIAVHADAGHPLVCSVTVLAEPTTDRPVTRDGARPGDGLYVTGRLGGAVEPDGGGRHLDFEPRVKPAIELAATLGDRLHAMIDLSDGLGRDSGHIAERSSVDIEIEAERLPLSSGVTDWRRAVADGEDYELCFAAHGPVPQRVGGIAVTRIGRIVTHRGGAAAVRVRTADGTVVEVSTHGWEHR